MRLIDADLMIDGLRQEIVDLTLNGLKGTPMYTDDLRNMINRLEDEDQAPTVDAVPVCVLKEILMRYFDIEDRYHFELTRVKGTFEAGTMSLDDFKEWTEEDVNYLVDYIKKNCANGEHKGGNE